eukprot:UN22934
MMLIQALHFEFRCLILVILSFDSKKHFERSTVFSLYMKEGQKINAHLTRGNYWGMLIIGRFL